MRGCADDTESERVRVFMEEERAKLCMLVREIVCIERVHVGVLANVGMGVCVCAWVCGCGRVFKSEHLCASVGTCAYQ